MLLRVVSISFFRFYFEVLIDYVREMKLYKAQRNVYIKDNNWLTLEDNGDLLTLAIQKKDFDIHTHYCESSNMTTTGDVDLLCI
jgi:predicted RNA-binding protein associated with RNAse of E/G family